MSVALWAGIFFASPFIFHQLWKFVAPGLYKKERRYAVGFGAVSALFFVGEYFVRYALHPEFERVSLAEAMRAYTRSGR